MWPGLEPNRGQYNETYLKQIQIIISEAEKFGIYTLLDMHQDVLSEKFCGEGVPAWAAIPNPQDPGFPVPLEATPYTNMSSVDGFPTRFCYINLLLLNFLMITDKIVVNMVGHLITKHMLQRLLSNHCIQIITTY